jgi:hypothetical protein
MEAFFPIAFSGENAKERFRKVMVESHERKEQRLLLQKGYMETQTILAEVIQGRQWQG